jgi:acyl-coenzyme A synthetase/AMP-(fatty) acid ligase
MRFTERSCLGTLFDHAAANLPDGKLGIGTPSPIMGDTDQPYSYEQLAEIVRDLSGWFPAVGVRPGDRVAITKTNHPDMVLLAAAASRAGAVPGLLSAAVPPEQAHVLLDRLQATAVVSDRATIERWGLTGSAKSRLVALDGPAPGAVDADDLRGAPAATVRPPAHVDPMVVTHTSGTTGVPKLVVHSAATVMARAKLVTMPVPMMSFRRRDRYVAYLPWNHARAVEFYTSLLHIGCPTLALSDPSPDSLRAPLGHFEPTVLESVPDVFLHWEGIAQHEPSLFSAVRLYLNAFDAMHPRTVRAFLEASPRRTKWLQGYGQSEIGCATVDAYTRRTVRPRGGRPPTLRSMGWAARPLSRIRVTDPETGAPLRKGQVGQLEVSNRGRVVTYLGEESLHARRVRGAWWTTGDLGSISRTGRTILHDRRVDAVPGIESCLEVEDRLLDALPLATEIAVLNMDGEAVPMVCTHDDRPLDRTTWAEAVRPLGAPLGSPVHLRWSDVPRTGTFKVRRLALVESLLDGSVSPIDSKEPNKSQTAVHLHAHQEKNIPHSVRD